MLDYVSKAKPSWNDTVVLACVALGCFLWAEWAVAHEKRDPLRIDVPRQPRQPNTTLPVLYTCLGLADCQRQAASFCSGFNYPNGRILFRDLPERPRPFPIYSVICFD